MEIELDILWIPQGYIELMNLGVQVKSEPETQKITFYSIENIQPYDNDGTAMSVVVSGGNDYVCNVPYEKLKRMIREINL